MRVSVRVIVSSIAACALAIGWMGVTSAAAAPASDGSGVRHIVVLHDDVDPDTAARDHGRRHGAKVERVYHNALKGYVASFKGTGASDVARDPRVNFVELDQKVTVHGTQTAGDGVTWGLDRIDQRSLPLSNTFTYNADGSGVTAYIIDSGIDYDHEDLGSRATKGFDAFGGAASDCDGHGTHVAGTVGGKTFGVAKNVNLVSVKVLGCDGSGSWSGVIAGIDWVTADHDSGERAVANMSLGGGASSAVDAAVSRSIQDGVTYAVAAGNGNNAGVAQDACRYSPARVPTALTIGATDKNDRKASFSNFGKCVDWFAPGVGILSSTMGGGSEAWNGTSMATPHTAGVVALYLSTVGSATPLDVKNALAALQTTGIVQSAGKGSPTTLLRTTF
jgi:subtilisin family serine protease